MGEDILDSPCPSVHLSICRLHGFQRVTQILLWNFNFKFHMCVCGLWTEAYWFSAIALLKWQPGSHTAFFSFWTLTIVWLWISSPNFSRISFVCMGRSLFIFSNVTFKLAAWHPYWIFQFPNSNYGLALNIKSKLHWHIICLYGKKSIDFQLCHFQYGCLAAILDILVSGLCRWHDFRSVTRICSRISVSNFICMLSVAIGQRLLIFRDVSVKMATWWP